MASFEELQVPNCVVVKSRAAAQEDDSLLTITTPDRLKQCTNEGNKLSDSVAGIGHATENKVRETLGIESRVGNPLPAEEAVPQVSSDSDLEARPEDPSSPEQVDEAEETLASSVPDSNEGTGEFPIAIKDLTATASEANEPQERAKPRFVELTIKVPVGAVPEGRDANYAEGGKVQFGRLAKKTQIKLTTALAKALICIREGLLARDERLDNGQPVVSNADVVRWLLRPVAKAIGGEKDAVA